MCGHSGEIKWKGRTLCLSEALAGERVGLTVHGDGIWEVCYSFRPLGRLGERLGKVVPLVLRHKGTLRKLCNKVQLL